METPDVLLVIPAFREVKRLPEYLKELVHVLADAKFQSRILVVDDGSPVEEQRQMLGRVSPQKVGACEVVRPICYAKNKGKGHAIIHGWRRGGEARFYGFVDADGAVPAYETFRLLNMAVGNLEEVSPCLWASRMPNSNRTVRRTVWRKLLSGAFAFLVNRFIQTSISDHQCGIKLIPQVCYKKIRALLKEPRYCFDIELLLAVRHVGYPIEEVPIDWREVEGGQFHSVRDGLAMLSRIPAILRSSKEWPGASDQGKS